MSNTHNIPVSKALESASQPKATNHKKSENASTMDRNLLGSLDTVLKRASNHGLWGYGSMCRAIELRS